MGFKPFNSTEEFASFKGSESTNPGPTLEELLDKVSTPVKSWGDVTSDAEEKKEPEVKFDSDSIVLDAALQDSRSESDIVVADQPVAIDAPEKEETISDPTSEEISSEIEVEPAGFFAEADSTDSEFESETEVEAEQVDINTEQLPHPTYYQGSNPALEPIKVIQNLGMNFCVGNAYKYLMRAGKKDGATALEDYKKAYWYLLAECEDEASYVTDDTLASKIPDILDIAEAFNLSFAVGNVVDSILKYWTTGDIQSLNNGVQMMEKIISRMEESA